MIYIIVPCYNEGKRLPLEKFKSYQQDDVEFLFVDDGSKDNTVEVLKKITTQMKSAEYLSFPKNQGKAEVVRQGFLYLKENKKITAQDWIGFWDADLATPLDEIKNFVKFCQFYSTQNVKGIWGSRVYRLGAVIKRNAQRHYISRVFATVMHFFFRIESYDSQCGAKLFKPDLAAIVFERPFVSRWIFDVEILLRASNHFIIEYPLLEWIDVEGSKITFKEIFRILKDILKVYHQYRYLKKNNHSSHES